MENITGSKRVLGMYILSRLYWEIYRPNLGRIYDTVELDDPRVVGSQPDYDTSHFSSREMNLNSPESAHYTLGGT